jgi:hypothetical protein
MKEAIIFDSSVTKVGGFYQSLASNAGSYIIGVNFCLDGRFACW